MNYLWSDITQAGRTTMAFSVAVAWAFAQLTAVSLESLRFLAPGVHPKCRLWTQSVSQSVRGRFAISRIDTVMFSVRPRCPLLPLLDPQANSLQTRSSPATKKIDFHFHFRPALVNHPACHGLLQKILHRSNFAIFPPGKNRNF